MKKSYYIFFIFIILITTIYACKEKNYDIHLKQSFIKFFGTSDMDQAGDIFVTNDKAYLITGSTKHTETSDDIYIAKLSQNGNTQWEVSPKDTLPQVGLAITQTNSNEIFVAAQSQKIHLGVSYQQLEILKYSNSGILLDSTSYYFNFSLKPTDIMFNADSTLYILGNKQQNNYFELVPPFDIFLFKINLNMDSIWFRTYGGENNDIANQMIKSSTDRIDIIGSTSSFANYNQAQSNILIFETDSNGLLRDKITLGNLQNNYGQSLCKATDGAIILAAHTIENGKSILYSAKIQLYTHQKQWEKIFKKDYGIYPTIILNDNDNYFIAGKSQNVDNSDFFLAKLNNRGDSLWFHTLGTEGNEQILSGVLSPEGGYTIIGTTEFKGNQMISTLKISSDGNF